MSDDYGMMRRAFLASLRLAVRELMIRVHAKDIGPDSTARLKELYAELPRRLRMERDLDLQVWLANHLASFTVVDPPLLVRSEALQTAAIERLSDVYRELHAVTTTQAA